MRKVIIVLIFLMPLFFSCINTRKASYFNDLGDSATFINPQVPKQVIDTNDLLSITVSSLNKEATEIFNLPNRPEVQASSPTGNSIYPAGYLVNENGLIRFPILGNIKAAGLTKDQLSELLTREIVQRKLLEDPIIDVRFLNYKVTVLGEVTRPTVISVPTEKISLLEALGFAGDLTIFGKRNNILVIRDAGNGRKVTKRIDINSSSFLSSPFYYLKANDIVYVEPNKAKVASSTRLNLFLPAIISGISASIIIFDRLAR